MIDAISKFTEVYYCPSSGNLTYLDIYYSFGSVIKRSNVFFIFFQDRSPDGGNGANQAPIG